MNATDLVRAAIKPDYERPLIVPHQLGMMNKYARAQARPPLTDIDGVLIPELIERYGSPLFVFSQKAIVERYRELKEALTRRYPKVRIAWSYKTNYLDGICKVFHREGAWAEVVSIFEYEKARHLGIACGAHSLQRPVQDRAGRSSASCQQAPSCTSITSTSSPHAKKSPRDTASRPRWRCASICRPARRRNGAALASTWKAVKRKTPCCACSPAASSLLAGLHCHIGTFILDPQCYRDAASKLAGLANEIRERHGDRARLFRSSAVASPRTTRSKPSTCPGEQATPSVFALRRGDRRWPLRARLPAASTANARLETGRALLTTPVT
jgi:diaminopimelate decarboxylase